MTSRRGLDPEAGTWTVELAVWTPLLVVVVLALVGLGRIAAADQLVTAAAHDAARAASLEHDPQRAAASAREAASVAVAGDVRCAELTVIVDTSDFRPGGTVSATVTCKARLADLGLPHLPGQRALSGRSVSPIDLFQSR
jgi:Flp pilus assembly protein TadG